MVLCITVCVVRTPWENMFLYDLCGASCQWHCQRLSRVHGASTHQDSSRLKSWAEALLNVLPLWYFTALLWDGEWVQKKKNREGSFSPDVTGLCNRGHSAADSLTEIYLWGHLEDVSTSLYLHHWMFTRWPNKPTEGSALAWKPNKFSEASDGRQTKMGFVVKKIKQLLMFHNFLGHINVNKQVKKKKKDKKKEGSLVLYRFIWSVRQTWRLCGLYHVTWLPPWLAQTFLQQLRSVVTTRAMSTMFFSEETHPNFNDLTIL